VSFAAITLCVASQRVFIVAVYFVIDSVRKLFGYTFVNSTKSQLAYLLNSLIEYKRRLVL
jgi:hypothetical protein